MGFLKGLGEFAGLATGVYLGGIIGIAGDIVGSDSLRELGEKAMDVSFRAGEALGDVAESIADTAVNASKKAITTYSAQQPSTGPDNHKIEKALDVFDE